jgi:hypothetical protein
LVPRIQSPLKSYFIPFSPLHYGFENLKSDQLAMWKKVAAVSAWVLLTLGIVTIPLALVVFRLLTDSSHQLIKKAAVVQSVALPILGIEVKDKQKKENSPETLPPSEEEIPAKLEKPISPEWLRLVKNRISPDWLRKNMLEHFTKDKGAVLDESELERIDQLMLTMAEIDKADKTKLLTIESEGGVSVAAPFKVRKIEHIKIGGVEYKLQLGTKYKLIVLAESANAIATGGMGEIFQLGKILNSGIVVLKKLSKEESDKTPADIAREMEFTNLVHRRAKGHQRGIQRAPYKIFNVNKKWGYYVPAYLSEMGGGELAKVLKKDKNAFGLNDLLALAKGGEDLFTGVVAIHEAGIAHRDIKPVNVGIQKKDGNNEEFEWVHADFGLATNEWQGFPTGTPYYLPIDDLLYQSKQLTASNTPENMKLVQKQDIFALACTFLEIFDTVITHESSFESDWFNVLHDCTYIPGLTYIEYLRKQMQFTQEKFELDNNVILDKIQHWMGSEIRNLIKDMLKLHPPERPTAGEALERWQKGIAHIKSCKIRE